MSVKQREGHGAGTWCGQRTHRWAEFDAFGDCRTRRNPHKKSLLCRLLLIPLVTVFLVLPSLHLFFTFLLLLPTILNTHSFANISSRIFFSLSPHNQDEGMLDAGLLGSTLILLYHCLRHYPIVYTAGPVGKGNDCSAQKTLIRFRRARLGINVLAIGWLVKGEVIGCPFRSLVSIHSSIAACS